MLEGIRENTSRILDAVKALALHSTKVTSRPDESSPYNGFAGAIQEAKQLQRLGDREEYSSIARQWRKYIQILAVVEENFTDNIEKMEEWHRREQDRQDQQPRWTDRDKCNHFTTILRLKVFTERQSSEIERLRDKVRSFRESLPGQLESIREDINFRGSQSINLFTYVTVVFLPLGFATGVLSMNGLPDHSTSMNLVFTALAALALTMFMLLNAEFVKGMAAPIAEVYRSFVQFLCSLFRLRQSWQIVKYTVFHGVVKPSIVHRAQHRKRQKVKHAPPKQEAGGQQSGPNGPRSHSANSKVHDAKARPSRSWLDIFKDISEFSFREAVESEKQKQEEAPLKREDKGKASQQGATSQVHDRVDLRSQGGQGDLDVEKALPRATQPQNVDLSGVKSDCTVTH